jgi:RNA polymerase sigma-70 factor (ECF subfamily)
MSGLKDVGERAVADAVQSGDEPTFTALIERHRRELQVHCYRMLGSLVESEDLVQETFLRAWSKRETFEGRSTFRAWLYRIATNACLDVLDQRRRRVLPHDVVPAADPNGPPPAFGDFSWLEPYPDHLLEAIPSSEEGPEAVVVAKETIELAFLAAIQYLPPQSRAVLILRDVLGWSAKETATLLELSVAAVKSALQRARATLREHLPARRMEWGPTAKPSEDESAVLKRYMDALEHKNLELLAAVLHDEVRVDFPPLALWADGKAAFIAGTARYAIGGDMRAMATRANMQPAVALYLRRPGETEFRLITLEVLRIEGGKVAEIVDYSIPEVVAAFGLPPTL